MKKRTRRERKENFKKVYYAELYNQGILDNNDSKYSKLTKAELLKIAEEKGIEYNSKTTKAELIKLIEVQEENTLEDKVNNEEPEKDLIENQEEVQEENTAETAEIIENKEV